jgi:nitronate monooxygenase
MPEPGALCGHAGAPAPGGALGPTAAVTAGLETAFTRQVGIAVPLVCGAMYPCSNPELVAAVSAAGGIGVVQPISLVYVFGHDFRAGLRRIRELTDKPIGMNAIVEKSARAYEARMQRWVDIALEEGVRFFVTALGNPRWVVDRVHAVGGVVYHDVTERRWAEKALGHGVDGLVCVNRDAGGHAGRQSPGELVAGLADLGVPLLCAGGVGDEAAFAAMLGLGYAGVQLGTRFIATEECAVHDDYKQAILAAGADDIVLTDKLSGVPCAVIRTPYVDRIGLRAGPVARALLRGRRTKHWLRTFYSLKAVWQLKRASLQGISYKDYFQAGRSVGGIRRIEPAGEVVRRFAAAAAAVAVADARPA